MLCGVELVSLGKDTTEMLERARRGPSFHRAYVCVGAVTLQMLSRTHSADSPGWIMDNTGWSLGRHTHEGVRWSGTQMSLSALGRGRFFTASPSLFYKSIKKTHSLWYFTTESLLRNILLETLIWLKCIINPLCFSKRSGYCQHTLSSRCSCNTSLTSVF